MALAQQERMPPPVPFSVKIVYLAARFFALGFFSVIFAFGSLPSFMTRQGIQKHGCW
jgi:hypothetical protein